MEYFLILLLSFIVSNTNADVCPAAYPDPGPCFGNCTDLQDMNIIRRQFNENIYFRFWHSSHGPDGSGGPQIRTAHAPNIFGHWVGSAVPVLNETTAVGTPGPQGSPPNNLFAPEVHLLNGKYYMYFTDFNYAQGSDPHGGEYNNVNVAVSNDLSAGSWTNLGPIGIPYNQSHYSRLDANLFTNSTPIHITFGSYNTGIYGMNMSSPTKVDTSSPPKLLIYNPDKDEGGFQYKYRNYHYLFFSEGNCCPGNGNDPASVYRIYVCRSLNLYGPYTDASGKRCDIASEAGRTLVLENHGDVYAPGAAGIIDDVDNGPIMYYQYMNKTIGYDERRLIMGWNPLRFDANGWPCIIAAN